jgi:hypothetical protein
MGGILKQKQHRRKSRVLGLEKSVGEVEKRRARVPAEEKELFFKGNDIVRY